MTHLGPVRPAASALALTVLVLVTGCSSSTTAADATSASAAPPSAPAASSAAAPAASSAAASTLASTAASPAGLAVASASTAGTLASPCDLLTVDQIASATGVTVPDGTAKTDDARQVQMCTWQSSDPVLIVAASLTDVGAEEAFKTNVDLAPAYFDGDAKIITVPGADKAYAGQQPDVGWVVGAIAKGRFVQVQVGGTGITQEQTTTLVQDAIAALPA